MKKETVKPSIRLHREFNEQLKRKLLDKGLSLQELTVRLLEDWVENN